MIHTHNAILIKYYVWEQRRFFIFIKSMLKVIAVYCVVFTDYLMFAAAQFCNPALVCDTLKVLAFPRKKV